MTTVRPKSELHGPISSSVSCDSGKRPIVIYVRCGSTGSTCRDLKLDPENRTGSVGISSEVKHSLEVESGCRP